MTAQDRLAEIRATVEQRHPQRYFPAAEVKWLLRYVETLREFVELEGKNWHQDMDHPSGDWQRCREESCVEVQQALRGPGES